MKGIKMPLGKLRIGDSFSVRRWWGKRQIWRVTGVDKHFGDVPVNQVSRTGEKPLHAHDRFWPADRQVRFIRHTVPVPGEWILVEELKVGDVFRVEEAGDDWMITATGRDFFRSRNVVAKYEAYAGRFVSVLYVGNAKDKQ